MKKEKKKPRARTLSRELIRRHDKLLDDRERLARLEAGGSAELPIVLEAASQLPLRAESHACLRCEGALRYVEDRVVERRGELRRAASVECKRCGTRRELWFQISAPMLN
jgi:hypothetical protein